MAKVNRFFQSPGVQQVRAIGLEEAMFLPSYMRQRHDAIAGAAAQMSVLDSAAMGQDEAAVRQILDPIEEEVATLSSDLAKNGYDPQKAEQLMNVQAQYQKAKRDGLAKIEGRLKTFQSEKQKIEEFYKENPRYAQHFSGLLSMANRGKATVDENGDVQVPGVKTPEYSKVLSTQEITDMTTQLFTAMEPQIRALDLQVDNIGGLYDIFTDSSIEGQTKEKIQRLFESTLNSMPDLKNSFKVKSSLAGVGLSEYIDPNSMSENTINSILDNDMSVLTSTLDRQLATERGLIKGRLANELMKSSEGLSEGEALEMVEGKVEQSDEYQDALQRHDQTIKKAQLARQTGNYQALGKAALETSANFDMYMKLGGIADGLSYQQTAIDKRNIQKRPEWIMNPKGDKDESLDFQTVNLEYANNEVPFSINMENIGITEEGSIGFIGDDVDLQNKFLQEKGFKPNNLNTIDRKDILEGKYKDEFKKYQAEEQEEVKNLVNLKNEISFFRNMDDNQFLDYINKYKEATKSVVTSGVVVPNDEGTKFRKLYLGSRDSNNNIKSPDLANQSTYSLNNGEADQTLHNIADNLGYDNIEELIQTGGFSQAVFVPNIGKWVATALDQNNEGRPTNIFISPTNELAKETSSLKEVTQSIMSAAPITRLEVNSSKTGTNAYLVNDYKSNKPYIVYTDNKIDINSENAYDQLMNEMSKVMGEAAYLGSDTMSNEDMAIMEARDFLSVGGTKVVNNNNFKSILSL